jgi:quercetin dioxygenase-like cupin family protein
MRRSRVLKSAAFRWPGVPLRAYDEDGDHFQGVTRQTLLGEEAGEEALRFLTRYFEVAPGGYSSLEHHRHPHAVIVLRGAGEVLLDGESHEIEPFDVVYVAPGSVHRFLASRGQTLGFLCVVDRDRDRPVRVEPGAR